jgi:hypothetical protein
MEMSEKDHIKFGATPTPGVFAGALVTQAQSAYAWLAPAIAAKEVLAVDVKVRPRQSGVVYSQSLEIAKLVQDYIRPGLILDCYA